MAFQCGGSDRPRSREEGFLLGCVRPHLRPEDAGRIRGLLGGEIGWEVVLEDAGRHGVSSLLHRNLNAAGWEGVPAAVRETLRSRLEANAWRNLALTRELLQLLEVLERAGVAALPFKGPALAAAAYGDLVLREFGDLDLLVRPGDLAATVELARPLGYRVASRRFDRDLSPRAGGDRPAALGLKYDLALEKRGGAGPLSVELHWRLLPWYFSPFAADPAALWGRLGSATLSGRRVPSLSAEDTLLYLCVHASKHAWEKLAWACDVAALVGSRGGWDWGRVLGEAGRVGAGRMVGVGLLLADGLAPGALPADLVREVQADPKAAALAGRARQRFFRGQGRDGGFRERPLPLIGHSAFEVGFHLQVKERLRDRLRYGFGLAAGVGLEAFRPDFLAERIRYCARRWRGPSPAASGVG